MLFFDSLVGYTLAKFRFRGRRVVFLAILSTLMIPTEMLVLPWYVMSKNLGWLDTYWGIMFPGMMTGFGTFLMKQFFESVPDELLEAGRVDGLGEFQIWWRIAMPLVGPALSALAIFTFLGNWTAFLWPLISTTKRELYTLPVGFASFSGEFQREWEMVMAGASVATLPVLLGCSSCSRSTSCAGSCSRGSRGRPVTRGVRRGAVPGRPCTATRCSPRSSRASSSTTGASRCGSTARARSCWPRGAS